MLVTVCQTCGDRGFSVALIYCDKCQAYSVHRYCLYKLPETFEENVVWFCANCEPKVVDSSTLQQALPTASFQSRLKKGSSVRESKGKNDIKKLKNHKKKKSKYDSGSLVISKTVKQRLRNHLLSNRLFLLTGFQSRLKKGSYVRKLKGKNGIKKLKKNKKKSKYDCGSLAISKVQRHSSPLLRLPENLEKDKTLRRSLGVDGLSSNEEARLIEAKTPPSNTCTHSKGSDWVNIDEGAESVNNRTSLVAINEHLNIIEHILDTGWRELDGLYSDEAAECVNTKTSLMATSNQIPKHGSFCLYEDNLTVGVVAHLSSLACLKVCEKAKCLPQLLRLELLPRCDVWPKGFKKWGPSEERRQIFDSLVDKMIGRDLGMRAVVQDVELLVYTSNMLPLHIWRFQEKFYLWGAFRAK
ncbi:hypothetical protein CRYUN_Cryun28dG0026800 [Craigia yunnanensis]